ncbi:12174_t:CDS:2, partial [Cetraspora pellucida]
DKDENNQSSINENVQNYDESDQSNQSDQAVSSSNSAKKLKIIKSKSNFQNSWLSKFKWLQYNKISQRMFCKYCTVHKKSNVFGRSINFNRKSSVKEHASSDQHIDAIRLEAAKIIADEASAKSMQKSEAHVIGVLKIVNSLVREDIPLSKLPHFVQLSRDLESPLITNGSITYENEISGCKFAVAISDTIKAEIWKEINITMNKHLDIYVIYLTILGNITTRFLQLLALDKCDAETITTKLVRLFQSYDVMDKLVAFASDSASVMIGNKSGVAQRLSQICPYLVYNHYIAHRLALVCKDTQKQFNCFINAETILKDVYKFYKNSSLRIHVFQKYQKILDCPELQTLPAALSQLRDDCTLLNKFFQKRNLYFRDIIPMIDATIMSIQKDYIVEKLDDQSSYLGYHLQLFFDHTKPFNEQSNIDYFTHLLVYNSCDYDDLLQDIYEYATMKILNPVEWPDKKELLNFGYEELQILLNHYGISKTINGQKFLPLIDSSSCELEWPGFKNIIISNFLLFSSQQLLPVLIRDYCEIFPNIIKLIHIANSILFSSVDCERRFFKQNIIKTHLRTSLTTSTLD